jgi:transposase-like protein
MPRTGRPIAKLVLTEDETETLSRWARRPNSAQVLAVRSKIVLACAEGATNKDVAARFGVTAQMVGKWRRLLLMRHLEGLVERGPQLPDPRVEHWGGDTTDRPPTPRTEGGLQLTGQLMRESERV